MWPASSLLAAVAFLGIGASADRPLLHDLEGYNKGHYGKPPYQQFITSDIKAPQFQVNTWEKDLIDDSRFIFVGLWSPLGGNAGPMIFSSEDLSLVYANPMWPSTHNTRIQKVHGRDYLTYFAGVQNEGHSSGDCMFFDDHYNPAYRVVPQGTREKVDMHECEVTDKNTVLITIYEIVQWDLREFGGPVDGKLMDSIFQEIDISTGNLLFLWRATDHIPLSDSMFDYKEHVKDPNKAWDYYHVNSVQKVK